MNKVPNSHYFDRATGTVKPSDSRKPMKYQRTVKTNQVQLGADTILINGVTGTGKTWLCRSLVKQAIQQRRKTTVVGFQHSYHDIVAEHRLIGFDFDELGNHRESLSERILLALNNMDWAEHDLLVIDFDLTRFVDLKEVWKFQKEQSVQLILAGQFLLSDWCNLLRFHQDEGISKISPTRLLVGQTSPAHVLENLNAIVESKHNLRNLVPRLPKYQWAELATVP